MASGDDDMEWRFRPPNDVAAEWFIRNEDKDLDETERSNYLRWLQMAPMHIAETLHLQARLDHPALKATLRVMAQEADGGEEETLTNVVELAPGLAQPVEVKPEPAQRPPPVKTAFGLAAAVMSCMLGFGIKVAVLDRTVVTEASDWRDLPLTDGSSVRVGPHSHIRFAFRDDGRDVYIERGEAYFEVAKDPGRPFVVHVEGSVNVRAVGTAFGVRKHEAGAVVTVSEGVVAITENGQTRETDGDEGAGVSVPVRAGEEVDATGSWPVVAKPVDVRKALGWARNELILGSGDTIAGALDEFNRRNRIQVKLDNPALENVDIVGLFPLNDPEKFAKAVEDTTESKIVREGEGVLRIVPRTEEEALAR